MKVLKLMVIAASVAATLPAMAAPEAGGMYAGVVLSKYTVEDPEGDGKSDQIGVLGGYNITPEISAELSYTTGDVDDTDGLVDITNIGFSLGYAYTFPSAPVYVKGKLGMLSQQLKIDAFDGDPAFKDTSVKPSYGVAVGARSGAFGAELGYTMSENEFEGDAQDVNLLSLTGVYNF